MSRVRIEFHATVFRLDSNVALTKVAEPIWLTLCGRLWLRRIRHED